MTHGAGEGEQQQQQQEQQQQQQEQQQRQGEEQPQQQQEQQQRQGDEEQLQQQQQQQEQQHRQEQQQQEQEQNELQEQQETEQEHHHDQQQQQQHGARGDNPGGGQAPLGRGALVGARGAPLGTPFWAAPELDVGDPHDERVDLFSFGVTFVELVTGRQPYYDTSPEGLAWLCSPEVGFLPNDLPEEVLEWLVPCLQAHPDDRPSAEQLLGCDFFVRVAEAEAEAEAANAVHALITDGAEKAGWKLEEEADEMEEADEVEEAGRKLAEEQLPACDAGGEASTQEQHTRLRVPIHEAALADACTFAANPPWLAFTHGCMLGHGVVYQGDGDASDDSWDASLPLVPLAGGDGDIGAAAVAAAAEGAAGADGDGGGGDYPHFDPEVVEEMRLLRLLPRA